MQPFVAARPRTRAFAIAAGVATASLVAAVAAAAVVESRWDATVRACSRPRAATAAAVPPAPYAPPALEVIGTPTAPVAIAGQPVPILFRLVNRTEHMVHAIRALDASDVGWRYPRIEIEVRDAAGNLVAFEPVGRCGNMNDLVYGDFAPIAPGDALDIFGADSFGHDRLDAAPRVPGRYTYQLRYDLSFVGLDGAEHGDGVDALIATLPHGIYRSAPVAIDVIAP